MKQRQILSCGICLIVLTLLLARPAVAAKDDHHHAEEAHHHDVVGTIKSFSADKLELETEKGKVETFQLNTATAIKRGDAPAKREELKTGLRVVVMSEEQKGKAVVVEVNLNAVAHEGHDDHDEHEGHEG